jgi:aquaporin Z
MGEAAPAAYIAEFVGTFLLVFTVGCNVLTASAAWGVTSIAAVLMVSIWALGGVSGGNFNPAVSLTLGLSGKMEWKEVAIYCVVQIVAGICAGLSFAAMLWKVVNVAPKPGFGWWEAMLAEVLYTFVLCFVVLNVAASTKNGCGSLDGKPGGPQQFYGLAIGFVVVAGGYGAGSISGGAFNPAVALGLDVSSAGVGFGWGFAYTGYEIIGSALAAGLFRVVRPDDFGGSPDYELGTRCVSEFLGTYVLVLTVGLNVLGGSPAGAWSIAASLMVMIFALGNCSGAHFNPAVTIAIMISGRDCCSLRDGAAYIVTQLVAGVCASYTYAAMHHGNTFALEPAGGHNWAQALTAEFVYTFVLCFVVLSVATIKDPLNQYFGLAIGSCVTVGGIAIGNVSGGSLNPAVSTGISAARIIGGGHFYNCLIYSAAEIAGAGVAAGVFMVTHPSEYAKGASLPILGASPVRP